MVDPTVEGKYREPRHEAEGVERALRGEILRTRVGKIKVLTYSELSIFSPYIRLPSVSICT